MPESFFQLLKRERMRRAVGGLVGKATQVVRGEPGMPAEIKSENVRIIRYNPDYLRTK